MIARLSRFVGRDRAVDGAENVAQGDPDQAPADRRQLGAHAKRLLEDHVLALAIDRVERKLVETWRNSVAGDVQGREAAYNMRWALQAIKAELVGILGDANVLEHEAARKEAEDKKADARRERALLG